GDVLAAGALKQLARFDFCEARIASFNHEEESVISHAAESVPVKNRMMRPRQSVHDEHREKSRECGEKHGKLEHDREKGGDGFPVPRFSVNHETIKPPRRSEFDEDGGE